MKLGRLQELARDEFAKHGLTNWTFVFDRGITRFGQCKFASRTISMSRQLSEANTEAECLNTLRHEIAHALVGPRVGHGAAWVRKAREIGCDGQARYSGTQVATIEGAWIASCKRCGMTSRPSHRRNSKLCCGKCARLRGEWIPLDWKPNRAAGTVKEPLNVRPRWDI